MSDLSTLRMPDHNVPDEDVACRGAVEPGYAHMLPGGHLHCNRCGWVTPESVVTTWSPETNKTYLTWPEYVAAETNGYVIVTTTSRRNTHPAVHGPYLDHDDAKRAQARIRRRSKKEEDRDHGPGHTVRAFIRVLNRETV